MHNILIFFWFKNKVNTENTHGPCMNSHQTVKLVSLARNPTRKNGNWANWSDLLGPFTVALQPEFESWVSVDLKEWGLLNNGIVNSVC